eukprot:NODE_32_length_3382_cov_81.683168_g24_i0.p1 GENE.NODE_32_length_3382_cov_81.683168_g24_i0~~NODE_32_length_3382_cov_81.683168_g24_i0.p1  ORF type:complete len:1047 (+),score=449.33 NODE_32_length_3382_cov_81.683168_g24_i0:243-3143(+)
MKELHMIQDKIMALHIYLMDTELAVRVNFTLNDRIAHDGQRAAQRRKPGEKNEMEDCWDHLVDILLEAAGQLPTIEPPQGAEFTTCYKAFSGDIKALEEKYVSGRVITWHGLTTAVRGGNLANHFLGWGGSGVLLIIKSRTGRSLQGLHPCYTGAEVLVMPDTTFRIREIVGDEKKNFASGIGRDLDQVRVFEANEVLLNTGRGVLEALTSQELYKSWECIPLLDCNTKPIDKDARQNTALHLAAKVANNADVVRLLIMAALPLDAVNNQGQSPLMLAIKDHPTPDSALALLEAGASVTQQTLQHYTALHYAAQNQHVLAKVFKELLQAGAKVNVTTEDQQRTTPLLLIASSPAMSESMILTMLDKGAKATDYDNFGQSVIHSICANANITVPILRAIIERGAQCNETDGYNLTPLLHLAKNENSNVIMFDMILDRGADVTAKDGDGRNALHRVLTWQHKPTNFEIVHLLFEKELTAADKDNAGATPLHLLMLSESVSEDNIKLFLEKGGSMNLKGAQQQTPLHVYCRNLSMKESVLKFLLNEGANVKELDAEGYSVLHHACSNPAATAGILKLLFDNGATVTPQGSDDGPDPTSTTPLQMAIQTPKIPGEVIHFLLENGSELPKDCDVDEHPLYMYLATPDPTAELRPNIVELLLSKMESVEPIVDSMGMTLLHYAAKHEQCSDKVLSLLLAKGAKVDATDRSGRTPLAYLCENMSISLAALGVLLDKKAAVNHEDGAKMRPLHILCANPVVFAEMLEVLIKAGAEVNAKDSEGKQAAHYICANTKALDLSLLHVLDRNKASFSAQDDDRNTPLHNAVKNPQCTTDIIACLMERGFDAANVRNRHKENPIDIANKLGLKALKKEMKKRAISSGDGDGGDDEEEEKDEGDDKGKEPEEYDVKLVRYEASSRINIIKQLMALKASLTIKEASKLVDDPPVVLGREKAAFAQEMKEKLEGVGASVLLL